MSCRFNNLSLSNNHGIKGVAATVHHTTAGYILTSDALPQLWDIPEPEEMSVKHKTQPYGG
ncbi:uncharacterized protein BO87DRAFT_278641, partial [Aspergillus neoniger CBS 115656]